MAVDRRELTGPPPSTGARDGVGTIGWELQREIVLLAAWGPAILLQLAHPLVARGVAEHSHFRERHGRLRRLHRTVHAMLALSFGTEQDARAAASRINAIHDRVNGRLPDPVGVFPAGTPYTAHDPALLAWVHATLVDMNIRVFQLFVRPLSAAEMDRYCAEATVIERYLPIPGGSLPRSHARLEEYIGTMLGSGTVAVGEVARELARSVVYPPAPHVAWPVLALMRLVTIGLLPPTIRDGYGLPWSARKAATLRRSAAAVRALLRVTPSVVRYWPAARRGAAPRVTSAPAP